MFSLELIKKLIQILGKNQALFIGSVIGKDYLSDYDKFLLKLHGINIDVLDELDDIQKMFYFGMYSTILGGKKSFKTKKKDFDKWLNDEIKKPFSVEKKVALGHLKQRAFTDITGLGNKIGGKLRNQIITANSIKKDKIRRKIKQATIKAFEEGKNQQQLASILKNLTGDWSRDFSRIANYVMEEAYAHGRIEQIIEMYGDDARVYKQTFPGVCKHCLKNYGAPGEEPVIYTIAELAKNGDNIGRKTQLPVIGPAHPWARSILHPIPQGYIWNDDLKRFVPTRDKKGVERKSKVKITIT